MLNIRDLRIDPASLEGKQLMEKPEDYIEVEFSGLEVNAYEFQGHVQFTSKTTGTSPVRKN